MKNILQTKEKSLTTTKTIPDTNTDTKDLKFRIDLTWEYFFKMYFDTNHNFKDFLVDREQDIPKHIDL